jgi:methyl-accepting chemotaxis protein
MTIRGKLMLGFGAMVLVLLAIGYEGYVITSDLKDFSEVRMVRALDASDGAMESRINYLAVIWGTLEGAASFEEEHQQEAMKRFQAGVEGFEESMELLQGANVVTQEDMQAIRERFDALVRTGRGIFDTMAEMQQAMEVLDGETESFALQAMDGAGPSRAVHLAWASAMAANDYAAYGLPEAKADYQAESAAFRRLRLPGDLAAARDAVTAQAGALVAMADAAYALLEDFDGYAEALDETMEVVEEGNQAFEGTDAFAGRLLGELQDEAASARVLFIAIVLAGVAIALLLMWVISRSISRPVHRVRDYAAEVSRGDLDAELTGTFSGELKDLQESIRTMVANLKEKMGEAEQATREAETKAEQARQATQEAEEARRQAEEAKRQGMLQAAGKLEDVVERTSSAAQELSAQMEQITRGSETQRERVAETATAMEEMNATVLEVAKNSSSAAENADENREKAGQGKDVVGKTIESVMAVQGSTAELTQVMNELSEKAESIGQVMNVITDIADQTNLLALNAAIEAARAGEAGRGFAVVADEVRKLAEKTMTATKEVGDAIGGIQDSVRVTADKRASAEQALEETVGLAQEAGEILGDILASAERATDMVRSIATAAEQQSATSEEINRSVEEINRIAAETSDGVGQSNQAIGDLAEQAQLLQQLIRELKS